MTSLETEMKHTGARVNWNFFFFKRATIQYNNLLCIVTIIKAELRLN